MIRHFRFYPVLVLAFLSFAANSWAQVGNSGTIEGTVKDPSKAAVANAAVEISYPVSGYNRMVLTGADGTFRFTNVPFNPYHLTVRANGFAPYTQDVEIRSGVPATLEINVKIGTAATSITVEAAGGDLVENDSTFHTDVDRDLFVRVPLESATSSVSSLVTLTTPGVAARDPGYRRRFQRPFSRPGRSRLQLFLDRWTAHLRSAEQSVLEPNPFRVHSVHGGHFRRASGRIRRQDQPDH